MKVYTITEFKGYWPVGTAAVVVANSREHAIDILEAELAQIGLKQAIPIDNLAELDISEPKAAVLLDGQY